MTYYEIEQTQTGHIMGVYEGDTGEEAIQAMLADAGSSDAPDPGLVAHEVEVSTDDIRALREQAGSAGDLDQVAICDRALSGDDDARIECIQLIAYARREAATP